MNINFLKASAVVALGLSSLGPAMAGQADTAAQAAPQACGSACKKDPVSGVIGV
jgi:hypothetical protein